MSKKQRYIELFTEHLPEPYRTAAISQIDEDHIEKQNTPENICEAIRGFKQWSKTKEDRYFWFAVDNHFIIPSAFPYLPPYPKYLLHPDQTLEPTTKPKQVQKSTIEVLNEIKEEGKDQYKSLMDILALTRKEIKELQTQNAQLKTEIQDIKNLFEQ